MRLGGYESFPVLAVSDLASVLWTLVVFPCGGVDGFRKFFVRNRWACKSLQGCQTDGVLAKVFYRLLGKDVETPLACQQGVVLLVGACRLDREDVHVSVVGRSWRQSALCGPDAAAKSRELNR